MRSLVCAQLHIFIVFFKETLHTSILASQSADALKTCSIISFHRNNNQEASLDQLEPFESKSADLKWCCWNWQDGPLWGLKREEQLKMDNTLMNEVSGWDLNALSKLMHVVGKFTNTECLSFLLHCWPIVDKKKNQYVRKFSKWARK